MFKLTPEQKYRLRLAATLVWPVAGAILMLGLVLFLIGLIVVLTWPLVPFAALGLGVIYVGVYLFLHYKGRKHGN